MLYTTRLKTFREAGGDGNVETDMQNERLVKRDTILSMVNER